MSSAIIETVPSCTRLAKIARAIAVKICLPSTPCPVNGRILPPLVDPVLRSRHMWLALPPFRCRNPCVASQVRMIRPSSGLPTDLLSLPRQAGRTRTPSCIALGGLVCRAAKRPTARGLHRRPWQRAATSRNEPRNRQQARRIVAKRLSQNLVLAPLVRPKPNPRPIPCHLCWTA